jgi:ATP-dependent Lhr-like helicase
MYQDLASDRNAHDVFYRYLQVHGPATPSELAQRYGISPERTPRLISRLVSSSSILSGHFRPQAPGEREIELCYRPNIEKIHRQTIAILRKEIKPSTLAHYSHFLLHWQHLLGNERETGTAGLELALAQLQGIPLPLETWERDILRKRVPGFTSDLLHQIVASGSVVWVGAGPARARIIIRGEGSSFLPAPASPDEKLNEPGRRVLAYLQQHGASFFADIRAGSHLSLGALNNGFAELFWGGLITNDNFAELLHIKRPPRGNSDEPLERIEMIDPRHNPHKARIMHSVRRAIRQIPGWSGRWSLVYSPGVMGPPVSPEEQAHRHALQLLDRYGIVARELCRREDTLTWPIVAAELQRMELRGEIRRGYFVEGLSGMQYAHPSAVEELRRVRSAELTCSSALLVNACDPANPFGTGIDLPIGKLRPDGMRFSRIPGNYLVFQAGDPIVFLEDYGTHIWTLAETSENVVLEGLRLFTAMLDLPSYVRPFKAIVVEHCDGMRPANSPLEPVLRSLGFRRDRNQTMRFDGYV